MKLAPILSSAALALGLLSCGGGDDLAAGRIVDHEDAAIAAIDASLVAAAKERLVVAYWHTSHGSQLVTGIDGMDEFFGGEGLYALNVEGGLALAEQGTDIGNPGIDDFDASVRAYLAEVSNASTNVVMASWCGQVSGADESTVDHYLEVMAALEEDFPSVTFVYMTGHADGTGLEGNLHLRDRQIRDYCEANGKWLFDFYDIECYDPDGSYFGDKLVTDACNYDYDGDGAAEGDESGPAGGDRNWALDWQAAHPTGYWSCSAAHSQALNGCRKAMAAWRLWCAIAASL